MLVADFPYLADWFAVAFRWLGVLGVAIALALAGTFTWPLAIVLLLAVLWNLFISTLAGLNIRLPRHRPINVGVDFLISTALFIFGGGLTGTLLWAGVLVLISAAVYYEWLGALLAAAAITAVEIGWTAIGYTETFAQIWSLLALLAGLNLVLGMAFGLPSRMLIQSTRAIYHGRVQRQEECEQQVKTGEHERMQAFYRLVESLSATLDYQTVLDTALDLSVQALGLSENESTQLVSAVLLFSEEDLIVGAYRQLSPTDAKRTFPGEQGVIGDTLRTGEPQVIPHPVADPELGQFSALEGMGQLIALPLMRGVNAYGVMIYAHPDPSFFTKDRMDMLSMLSHQSVIAIQNARLFQELAEEKDRILAGQEETRKKLASDLHDGPTQAVSAIAMRAATARRLLEMDPRETAAELEWIEGMARRTTDEIRHMLFTLRPLVLESQGLIPALESMADKMADLFRQRVQLDVDPRLVDRLDLNRQTLIFHLAEEAVNNARKHAQADRIIVRFKYLNQDESVALLEIADNGTGFDVDAVHTEYERRGSLGMVNLRERAELLNGYLNLQSSPGKGTRVQVFIPLTPQAVDRLQNGILKKNSEH